ncbi:hypothetical protein HUT17_04900 (plasmid) [Nocardiopsis flavescens]|nr:hypothetical protein HUT17_04900 [Nocardiopsis flavescens]
MQALRQTDITVSLGHSANNIHTWMELIVAPLGVAGQDAFEDQRGHALGLPVVDRVELVGAILQKSQHGIGTSGTQGKSTTTCVAAGIFEGVSGPTRHLGRHHPGQRQLPQR